MGGWRRPLSPPCQRRHGSTVDVLWHQVWLGRLKTDVSAIAAGPSFLPITALMLSRMRGWRESRRLSDSHEGFVRLMSWKRLEVFLTWEEPDSEPIAANFSTTMCHFSVCFPNEFAISFSVQGEKTAYKHFAADDYKGAFFFFFCSFSNFVEAAWFLSFYDEMESMSAVLGWTPDSFSQSHVATLMFRNRNF